MCSIKSSTTFFATALPLVTGPAPTSRVRPVPLLQEQCCVACLLHRLHKLHHNSTGSPCPMELIPAFLNNTPPIALEGAAHGSNHLQCFFCGIKTEGKLALVLHVSANHNEQLVRWREEEEGNAMDVSSSDDDFSCDEERLECKFCERGFDCPAELQSHIMVHGGTKPYSCTECGITFSKKLALVRHKQMHTGSCSYECTICGKVLSRKHILKQHMKMHDKLKHFKFSCSVCRQRFKTVEQLENHLQCHISSPCSEERTPRKEKQQWSQEEEGCAKPFVCPHNCGKSYSQKSSLNAHVRTHTGDKPFECPDCGKTFSRKPSMKRHRLSHTGERPFECTICSKRFSRKDVLYSHIQRTHSKMDGNSHKAFAIETQCSSDRSFG